MRIIDMGYDKVSRPAHYTGQGGIECIDFITVVIAPYQGVVAGDLQNILKYVWRADYKNGLEDLKKACWYAEHIIKTITAQQDDVNQIQRAWRTVFVKRTQKENELLDIALLQVKSHMTDKEKKCFDMIISAIIDGNLYQLKDSGKQLLSGLQEWASIYSAEKKLKEKQKR